MKKTKVSALPKPLQPYSLEERSEYIARFANHPDMIDLFPSVAERATIAGREFEARWWEALATVTLLNGSRYFID